MADEKKNRLAVFDFDGTLFFNDAALIKTGIRVTGKLMTREQIRGLPEDVKSVIYNAAAHYIDEYVPNPILIGRLGARRTEGYRIVILTARQKSSEADTLELLRREDIPYDEIRCDQALAKIPDEEFKLGEIKSMIQGYAEVEIYEDKADNISYLMDNLGTNGFSYYLVTNGGAMLKV
jgi:phosphoglycolate phosphatase-like HAD superfamily hydrolase